LRYDLDHEIEECGMFGNVLSLRTGEKHFKLNAEEFVKPGWCMKCTKEADQESEFDTENKFSSGNFLRRKWDSSEGVPVGEPVRYRCFKLFYSL